MIYDKPEAMGHHTYGIIISIIFILLPFKIYYYYYLLEYGLTHS